MNKIMGMMIGTIALGAFLTGCSGMTWWATKQVASETAEDVAEGTNLRKTKEELREDIGELKKKLREEKAEKARLELRVKELEATCPGGLLR